MGLNHSEEHKAASPLAVMSVDSFDTFNVLILPSVRSIVSAGGSLSPPLKYKGMIQRVERRVDESGLMFMFMFFPLCV